ncbi:MAG: peptidoglycan DD-metalloendopeptidase family protein [Kastovskya adunca ATA6-11-RM4]|jgi:murein DD-endopeptidase MepM/ murein hydrolase activator NlpD|nr:peptidoglycan DD-metalloendopeptidase family protein [Kastovskya adunca ATA6-11-RM4]
MKFRRTRRQRFKFLPWLGLFLLCCLLTATTPTLAQTAESPSVDTLREVQKHLDQERAIFSKESDRLTDIEKAAQGYLNNLGNQVQATETQIQDYNFQIELANKQIQEIQEDLAIAEQVFSQKQTATIARLRFLQRQQLSTQGWDILLKSQNFNEFLNRRERLKRVYQADQEILLNLKAAANDIQIQKLAIEQQKNQIALLNQQLLAQKAEYEKQFVVQQQLIERLNSDRLALDAAHAQLVKDSQNIGILIQQKVTAANKARLPGGIIIRGTGQLSYPSDGTITSSFGWRNHPVLGYGRFHAGLDFGASYGSTIRAADRGTVIFSGWYGGYGYAVVIDHGDAIATLYGHASKLHVSEGQTVEKGEAIAAVGSTGLSTGPHLHFEVRQNGEPVDPLSYL